MTDRNDQHQKSRRVRDRSVILLLVGLALLISPMARIFDIDAKLGGIPVTLIYLFTVWAVLIVASAWLSYGLRGGVQASEQSTQRLKR